MAVKDLINCGVHGGSSESGGREWREKGADKVRGEEKNTRPQSKRRKIRE